MFIYNQPQLLWQKKKKAQDDLPDTSPEMVKSLFLAWGQIVLVSQGAKLLPAMVSIISISIWSTYNINKNLLLLSNKNVPQQLIIQFKNECFVGLAYIYFLINSLY